MINIDFQDINIMGVTEGGGSSSDLSNYYTKSETDTKLAAKASKTELNTKVDKVTGKGLSTNDYTTVEKNKLASLSNYDDTAIKQQITNLDNKIGDINTALDSINGEVI